MTNDQTQIDYTSKAFRGWRDSSTSIMMDGDTQVDDTSKLSEACSIRQAQLVPDSVADLPLQDLTLFDTQMQIQGIREVLSHRPDQELVARLPKIYSNYAARLTSSQRLIGIGRYNGRPTRLSREIQRLYQSRLLSLRGIHPRIDSPSRTINSSLCVRLEGMDICGSRFLPFPRLPAELRTKIYQMALPRERLVELWPAKKTGTERSNHVNSLESSAPLPALLHTCAESRYECLRYYRPQFGACYPQYQPDDPMSRVYFDAGADLVFLNCQRFPRMPLLTLICLFYPRMYDMWLDGFRKLDSIGICTEVARMLIKLQDRSSRSYETLKESFAAKFKRVVCIAHDAVSLRDAILVPHPPNAIHNQLQKEEIDVLEELFGQKVEFAFAEGTDSCLSHVRACKPVSFGYWPTTQD